MSSFSFARSLRHALLIACALGALVFVSLALAAGEPHRFDDPSLAGRYQALTEELRCPKCENQNLASSNAPIAADMRDRISEWLNQGRSDEQIRQALVDRFGEYVLYKPRIESRTWLLWGLPGLAVLLGLVILGLLIIRARRERVSELDERERARLAELLEKHAPEALDEDDRQEPRP